MQLHIISFTEKGFSLAKNIQNLLYDYAGLETFSEITVDCASSRCDHPVNLSEWTKTHFQKETCLVFVGAAGIAVRAIASFVNDKTKDPAVLVIDENASFVIPLLSGHIGGANRLARIIAEKLSAQAVITTASDVNNLPPIDEFAAQNGLMINDMEKAKDFSVGLLHRANPVFSISVYIKNDILNLIPKSVILGIGCKKGKSAEELESFICETLAEHKIDFRSLEKIASIDLKKDENAILSFAHKFNLSFVTFSAEDLNKIPQKVSQSDFVSKITGTDNVCERAVFAAGAEKLLVPKICHNGMTLAVGERKIELQIPEILKECQL